MTMDRTPSVADIAIVGLGEVGTRFLEEMHQLRGRGIRIVCAAENNDTPGRRQAEKMGIRIVPLDEIIGMGTAVDVIFDLTGAPAVRRMMREKMQETGNRHTIIAPETLARLLWAVVSEDQMAGHGGEGGY